MKHSNFTRLCARWVFLLALFCSGNMHAQVDCGCTGGPINFPVPLYPDMNCMTLIDTFDLDDLTPCSGDFIFFVIEPTSGDTIATDTNEVMVDLHPYIGDTLLVTVENPQTNGGCSSYYEVIEDVGPMIECPFDTVSCVGFPDSVLMPIVTEQCSNATLSAPVDSFELLNCVNDFFKRVHRDYSVTDLSGNVNTCRQEIMIRITDINDVVFPPQDTLLDCLSAFDPSITGEPTLNGIPFMGNIHCSLTATSVDNIDTLSCGNVLILRDWIVTDECGGNPLTETQIIRLVDTIPPVFNSCNPQFTFVADQNCMASVLIPSPDVTDNCSLASVRAFSSVGEGTFMNGQFLFSNLTEGTYPLTFIATDSCGYQDSCLSSIVINDITTPTAVCDPDLTITLDNFGNGVLQAINLDEGSSDACGGGLDFLISRNGIDFDTFVSFDCADALVDSVLVTLLVIDQTNTSSTNFCMEGVTVVDKTAPMLVCPANMVQDCDFDYSDLSVFGDPLVMADECGFTTVTDSSINITNCGTGTIERMWTITDPSNNESFCTQMIEIQNLSPFDGTNTIIWPEDYTSTVSCITPDNLEPDDLPAGFDRPILPDDPCAMLFVSQTDQLFYIDFPSCYKIVRTWKVIDMCQTSDPNSNTGIWQDQQVIAVMDTTPPTINSCPASGSFGLTENCGDALVNLTPVTASGLCSGEEITITNDSPYAFANGANASGNYPAGVHQINFTVTDGCGNEAFCSVTVTVGDDLPPTPFCKIGIIAELQFMPNANPEIMAFVNADHLNYASFDNCSADADLTYTIRLVGDTDPATASSLVFGCDDEGVQDVEIWVTDEAGNADYCVTEIIIQDNMDLCADTLVINNGIIGGGIATTTGDLFPEVHVDMTTMGMSYMTDDDGHFIFENLTIGGDYTIEPWKNDDPKNGVTTYDIVLMTRHILNISPLTDPYKLIAADVNNSGSVTTFDIVALRKLILGISHDFPNNDSWRFIRSDYIFPEPTNPFSPAFPEAVSVNNLSQFFMDADFIGVKIGDINNSVSVDYNDTQDRNTEQLNILTEDRKVAAGEMIEVPVYLEEENNLLALQFTLEFETDLELQGIEKGALSNIAGDRFITSQIGDGIITGTWYHTTPVIAKKENALFSLRFKSKSSGMLSDMISLTSRYTEAVAYDERELPLILNLGFSNPSNMQTNQAFQLHQNQPNPFKRVTNIAFTLPEAGPATLTVFDVSGNILKTYDRIYQQGYNEISILRQELPTGGVLFYQLQTPMHTATKKMILLQ